MSRLSFAPLYVDLYQEYDQCRESWARLTTTLTTLSTFMAVFASEVQIQELPPDMFAAFKPLEDTLLEIFLAWIEFSEKNFLVVGLDRDDLKRRGDELANKLWHTLAVLQVSASRDWFRDYLISRTE